MTQEAISPSQIRTHILGEHEKLRRAMSALELLLNQPDELRDQLRLFLQSFRDHICTEEALLEPALLVADGFGPARVRSLHHEHEEQFALIDKVARQAGTASPSELVELLRATSARIRADMDDEERTHLSNDVLKDDVITTSFVG